jgi:predicted ATPase
VLDRSLEDTLPYLFSLLGIADGDDPLAQMDGQIRKRRTLEAIKRILLRESLNQPLIVVFEDLHWMTPRARLSLTCSRIPSGRPGFCSWLITAPSTVISGPARPTTRSFASTRWARRPPPRC